MPTSVIMPELGESVIEGTVGRWLVKVGDTVKEYDPLVEIETDKVTTEIPAPASGVVLQILAQEGEVVKVGTVVAVIGQPGEEGAGSSDLLAAVSMPTRTPEPVLAAQSSSAMIAAQRSRGNGDSPRISPIVARIAAEHRVDVSLIPGTGRHGRVTKKDILAFIEQGGPQGAAADVPVRPAIQPAPAPAQAPADHIHKAPPPVGLPGEVVNLRFTAYFVSAAARALRVHPMVNSRWTDEGVYLYRDVNIGMAVAVDEGLIVPVIKHADELSVQGIARQVNDLAIRARNNQLKPDEVQGGTFPITNHGVSGRLFATPIINQPQTGILGVGAIQKRVIVTEDDSIAIRPMVYLTLTFDHRVLDGAAADFFVQEVKQALENWSS